MLMVIAIVLGGIAQTVFVIGAVWMLWKVVKFMVKFVLGGLKAGFTTRKMKKRAKARQKRKFDRKVEREVKKQVKKEKKEIRKEYCGKEAKRTIVGKVLEVVKEEVRK